MKIIGASERLAETRGVKALIVGPVGVGNAVAGKTAAGRVFPAIQKRSKT